MFFKLSPTVCKSALWLYNLLKYFKWLTNEGKKKDSLSPYSNKYQLSLSFKLYHSPFLSTEFWQGLTIFTYFTQ